MSQNPKERFLNACFGRPVDRPPVWMMRQAGRYLPEYRAIRARTDTLSMMKTPSIAAEITLQPLEAVGVEAAILYSDILVVPDALGQPLQFKEGEGPVFEWSVNTFEALGKLKEDGFLDRLDFVAETLHRIKMRLPRDYPLLGFAGAPFTVANYMVAERGEAKGGEAIGRLRYQNPALLKALLERLTEKTLAYFEFQIASGVDALQLFDTWAGSLSLSEYAEWAFPYQKAIVDALRDRGVPLILYMKDSAHLLEKAREVGVTVLSVDWRVSLPELRRRMPTQALQGNLDPNALFAPAEKIKEFTHYMISSIQNINGYIANLGHGILPKTPIFGARAFVEAVKGWRGP